MCGNIRLPGNEVNVPEALAFHALHGGFQLLDRIQFADVVPARELIHVTPQVFDAHLVVNAVVASFQHGPETLDPVGMRLFVHVLAHGVFDGMVQVDVPQALVCFYCPMTGNLACIPVFKRPLLPRKCYGY